MLSSPDDGWIKLSIAWLATIIGSVTLSNWVLGATLILTVLQIWVTIRREIRRDKESKTVAVNDTVRDTL